MDENAILNLIKRQLGRTNVNLHDRLLEDLGAESADLVNIIATLEDDYNIVIDEESISSLHTVRDVVQLVQSLLAS